MLFDKAKYWEEKSNNIGSKRNKPFTIGKFLVDNRADRRKKTPHIRNDKKHRDETTAAWGLRLLAEKLHGRN